MLQRFFSSFVLLLIFTGCGVTPSPVGQHEATKLSTLLHSTHTDIPKSEADRLAKDILTQTQVLTKEFELTSPALFHNFLVNTGVRDKGLCYQWSDALYAHLSRQHYPSFSFHLFGANIGEYFTEHNTLVVVAKGAKLEEGIVVDPWRNSGKLYFSTLKEDKAYKWQHRPTRGCCHKGK